MQTNFTKKDFIGLKNCYGIPQNNSISRNISLRNQIKEFKVESVGKNIIKTSSKYEHRLSIDGSLCKNNFGYLAFPTLKDAEEYLLKIDLVCDLNRKRILEYLSYDELIKLSKRIKSE